MGLVYTFIPERLIAPRLPQDKVFLLDLVLNISEILRQNKIPLVRIKMYSLFALCVIVHAFLLSAD